MARSAKAIPTKTPAKLGRPPGRSAPPTAKTAAKAPAATRTRRAVEVTAAPKPSKDELRARVEDLERINATLRAKLREANRGAKISAARIGELEDLVAQLEKQAAPSPASAAKASKPAAAARRKRPQRSIDPGDAVPPGVAVQEPVVPDEEAEIARENLEAHLGSA